MTAWAAALLILLTIVLFEVSFDPQFALPKEADRPDAEQEAGYAACYAERDAEIHRLAFGTIDNPDVQKEFINTRRGRAAAECRVLHPEKMVTVTTPLRIKLVDLEPRYW
jgi:hypothetical protein